MSSKSFELFDTCILIDYLSGAAGAKVEIDGADEPAISHITWIEVMVGTTPGNAVATRQFLLRFQVLNIDEPIGERAIVVRQGNEPGYPKKPKLPDAMIYSTALVSRRVLVTRNGKDFPPGTKSARVPGYAVSH